MPAHRIQISMDNGSSSSGNRSNSNNSSNNRLLSCTNRIHCCKPRGKWEGLDSTMCSNIVEHNPPPLRNVCTRTQFPCHLWWLMARRWCPHGVLIPANEMSLVSNVAVCTPVHPIFDPEQVHHVQQSHPCRGGTHTFGVFFVFEDRSTAMTGSIAIHHRRGRSVWCGMLWYGKGAGYW